MRSGTPSKAATAGDREVRLVHSLETLPAPSRRRAPAIWSPPISRFDSELLVGIIHNGKARHNISRDVAGIAPGAACAAPQSHDELHADLASFAARGVNALVIDGGDGTVRDVATIAARYFAGQFPRVAIVPSGKTNALALDLGVPHDWTLEDALDALRGGGIVERAPLEIWRRGSAKADLRGFIFGAGAFARATGLAQKTHSLGAFNGLAVGLSIVGGVLQTLFAGAANPWRRGERMRIAPEHCGAVDREQYLLLASTLTSIPAGIKPFGTPREGLKLLRIDAPPRRMVRALAALMRGSEADWLAEAGYHRHDATRIGLTLDGGFILDGETFAGGEMTLRQGAPMRFVVP